MLGDAADVELAAELLYCFAIKTTKNEENPMKRN